MERWEIIERNVLFVVAAGLLGWSAWLFFFKTNPEKIVGGAFLLLCAYWALWQALYEDKLGSAELPSRGERLMVAVWLWGRRFLLGGISVVMGLGAWYFGQSAQVPGDFGVISLFGFLSLMAGWVAVFGAGRSKSMGDDRSVHKERMRRYK